MACEDYSVVSLAYLGHDNATIVIPYSDISARTNYDMTNVTEVQVSLDLVASVTTGDDVEASSDAAGPLVWFDDNSGEWRIYFKAGMFSGVAAGEYKARIIIIEPSTPNGVVVCDDLRVTVVDVP